MIGDEIVYEPAEGMLVRAPAAARVDYARLAVSGATVFGIVVTIVCVIGIVVVGALFLWGAREDGRDQERLEARLDRESRNGSGEAH